MNPNQVIEETKRKIESATVHLEGELKKLRTGRVHPSMLDGVMVEAYGQAMPLKAVASIAAPEAQLLQITPFDPSNLQAIASAIRDNQTLDLTPTDDGHVVRVAVPPLTTETRQQMVKVLHQKVEDCMIAARNARHESQQQGWQAEKDKVIGKDDYERLKKQLDELVAHHKQQVEALARTKEQEILTV